MFKNILIRGTNWIGDSVITVPAIREVRRIFPEARITLLVRPWVKDIFEHNTLADEILTYDSRTESFWNCVSRIYKKYDAAILFQNAFEAALLMFCARIPVRIGFPTDGRRFLLTDVIPLRSATKRKHQMYYYLDLLSIYEERIKGNSNVNFCNPDYKLIAQQHLAEIMKLRLQKEGIIATDRLIVINPGATNSTAKRWSYSYFSILVDKLVELGDIKICLIGANNECEISNQVAANSIHQDKLKIFTGQTTLAESIALLSLADLVISNDTGPAYLAAALQRPLLTIFGPTDPNSISPFSPTSKIVREIVNCGPCLLPTCPFDHRCMSKLTPESVFFQSVQILNNTLIV